MEATKNVYSTVSNDGGIRNSELRVSTHVLSYLCVCVCVCLSPELYEEVLVLSDRFLPDMTSQVLPIALSLHIHSPAIEMYQQLSMERLNGSQCEVAVEVMGKLVCSLEELHRILDKEEEEEEGGHADQLFSFDHRYPSPPSTPPPPTAVLYAELGTQPFSLWHDELVQLAREGRLTYVLRHYIKVRVCVCMHVCMYIHVCAAHTSSAHRLRE